MSYNSGSKNARNFKSATCFALVRFVNFSLDYSLNCTPPGLITITNNNDNNNKINNNNNNNNNITRFKADTQFFFASKINFLIKELLCEIDFLR